MKHLIIIATLLVSVFMAAQTNYEKGMQKAFQLWGSNQTTEAVNLFERIAKAEPDNWLPLYYAAQINIVSSFDEKDEEKLSAQLKKAQNLINDATAISKDNPEILVLQALLHTAWVAYDGATYGMTLSGKVVELYVKAAQIAPENPRVVFSKAEWDMGGARYFGQDTTPFCKDVERSLELFANFKPETPFHPNWGKERAEQILKSCKQ
ncbi:tetratricopeptide repeat protein [Wocania ichthyoenteri]|uniref:tetratricopeptide repeat protein n=1 Tax=Wocania ichthyoenteri TaxID=1230531 RepID=UPI00053DEAB4|nr:tetratricopeptide repeat protein [Wocania ichthyoenteri]